MVLAGRHGTTTGGFAASNLLASYLHVHLAPYPAIAEAFVSAAARSSPGSAPGSRPWR